MEMLRPIHLNNTAPSSPIHYTSPSTPKHFGDYYISAPTSPSQLSHFYRDFDDLLLSPSPPTIEAEFAFDVSGDFGNPSLVSADELFHGGVIKSMQLPASPRSTVSRGKDFLVGALSPRSKKDPNFSRENNRNKNERSPEHVRGRERTPLISSSSRRATRSLSPARVSQFPWGEAEYHHQYKEQSSAFTKPTSSIDAKSALTNSGSKGSRKWRFKDFFLFRSASEGRAADKDPLRKYTAAIRKCEEIKGSGSGSGSGSVSKRRGKVSAHEMHYTANRAVSEDLKKKTFLPYKQGILGRLAFNPTVHGFGFSRK